ncbi:glutathione transferase GstA [Paraburkholderia rhizosphaerae]|uniref:Glutathione S-transferase n=1 Tax=Paraburkholderia rhizosphaerae TaxID=480658 RepID=A0A4R8LCA0_9BURK|nr:glutathione transferase GstA [Paraburkholderia rhizosphaerae]TDY40517.1 glutathione S-transferase [Paraburkholderia rhizosphaerae]
MKLYYSPGACSLAPHIVAREAGIALELEQVNIKTKRTGHDADFWQINPKGSVPVLELDTGEVLTEGPAIMQYLADLKPECKLAPANGTLPRYRLQAWLGFINSEVHKSYSPLFQLSTPEGTRSERRAALHKHYALLERQLAVQPWLNGDDFSAADAYLFTVTNWASYVHLDISPYSAIVAFQQRVAERPHVQAAMDAEGLTHKPAA